jgi:hypothetical protein
MSRKSESDHSYRLRSYSRGLESKKTPPIGRVWVSILLRGEKGINMDVDAMITMEPTR